MFINIQSIQGDNYSLDIDDDSFVSDLKKILSKKMSVIEERINLIYCGNLLTDYIKISEYDIQNSTIIHMIIRDEREYWKEQVDSITGAGSIKMTLHIDFETPCAYTGNYRSFRFDFNENKLLDIEPYDNQSSGLVKVDKVEADVNKFISYLYCCTEMEIDLEEGRNIDSYTYMRDEQMLKINSSIPSNKSGRTFGIFKIKLNWRTNRLV